MPHKRRAIVIAGEWNSPNLGDEIICNAFKFLLKDCLPDDNLISLVPLDISMNASRGREKILESILWKLNKKLPLKYKSMLLENKLKQINGLYEIVRIIVPGGQLFQEYFVRSLRSLIKKALEYNIPVFFNACGYGPNSAYSLSVFKWIVRQSCVKQLTTRDDLSPILSENVKVIPDAAIMAYRYYNFIVNKSRRKIIGINIMAPSHYMQNSGDTIDLEYFNQKMMILIEKVCKEYNVVLFSNGDPADQKYADWLFNKTCLPGISIVERPKNGFELIKIICGFSLVIGFRLHSLIVSYSYNIPIIGIAWDNKLRHWGKMTGNENIYMFSELPVESISELIDKSMRMGTDKNKKTELEREIIEQIKTYIPDMEEK